MFGGPPEFQTRPDGIPGIAETYGCTFKEFKALDTGGPLTVAALKDGTIQAADLFTTDPTIEAKGFVVLEDPKNNFAAQNVVPLINKAKATPKVTAALNAVSAKLTTEGLHRTSTPRRRRTSRARRPWPRTGCPRRSQVHAIARWITGVPGNARVGLRAFPDLRWIGAS